MRSWILILSKLWIKVAVLLLYVEGCCLMGTRSPGEPKL